MDLDLLKKLTRLANNNPNDNEANLAARKVCKILEAGNWALTPAPVIPKPKVPNQAPNQQQQNPNWKPYDWKPSKAQEDFFRKEEERLKQEQKARANKYAREQQDKEAKARAAQEERAAKMREEIKKKSDRAAKEWSDNPDKFKGFDLRDDPGYWKNQAEYLDYLLKKSKNETMHNKRLLKCSKCGDEVETGFIGHPAIFECFKCQYNSHNRDKDREKRWW